MGFESGAVYINDLQPTNPTSTDAVSQGDDHLRLIKQVLQNQFQGASKQWAIPTMVVTSSGGPINRNQMETTFFVNTGTGPITFILPTGLAAADVGWSCSFFKYSTDTNPMFIAPPTGATLNSGPYSAVAKARRCIPGVLTKAFWNGVGGFLVTRVSANPIGTLLDYWGSTLPQGYEWPNGQTLVIANYPEYAAAINATGATPDVRGLTCIPLDNLGGAAAGRLGSIIAGTTLGAVAGTETVALAAGNIPTITSLNNGAPSYSVSVTGAQSITNFTGSSPGGGSQITGNTLITPTASGTVTIGVNTLGSTSNNTGGASPTHSNLQPSIMVGKIMVVE